ncbi:alpha/beta hydrolase [Thalassospira sp.]|uniref:alpha/beta fold hydrolase n=1 Tax=Thalassospira sp. TaxID=1912094 RepID=UPI000C3D0F64|nr:alpha/beta hydrolase [Thalassospira sp.]MBC08519.1 alpha/beta hydrolase [Thalassospira sp.]|tara:strand:- start:2628 stop:3389 length:762 start_codon:yes stop_codon:yes gene_type:complete
MSSTSEQVTGQADDDGVPVVFLSGMLADQRMWHPALAAYADFPDVAKPAITPVFCELFDQDTVVDMARAVLEVAPDRFALVGMSMGGYAAFEILRQARSRISHLMLVNTRATADSDDVRRRRLLLSRIVTAKDPFVAVNDGMLDEMLHPDNRDDVALVSLITKMGDQCGVGVFERQNHAVAMRPDSVADVGKVNVPCSVIVGTHDRIISPESHREMADAIPGATYQEIPGAGHYAPLEQPHVFAQSLAELLRR